MRYLLLISLIVVLSACKKHKLQSEKDDDTIKQYLTDHNLTATKTDSGLYVIVTNPGTGDGCGANSTVKVAYKGYYTDGSVFDQSTGAQFSLQSVIKGWTEGIPYFKEGGNGVLLIPSKLGYGETGSGSVPGNTVLIFDVKLIDVL